MVVYTKFLENGQNFLYPLTDFENGCIMCKVRLLYKAVSFTHFFWRADMDGVEKNLRISRLLDYYGSMLTEKQRGFIDLYYNEDFSLAEIAEHENITRQGVRDSIKHGEQILFELEEKLHLAEKSQVYFALNERVSHLAHEIHRTCGGSSSGAKAAEIEKLMKKYKELF